MIIHPAFCLFFCRATGKQFVPPYEDPQLKLGGLLALNLHEFSSDVEEIADQVGTQLVSRVSLADVLHLTTRTVFTSSHLRLHACRSPCAYFSTGNQRGEDGSYLVAASREVEQHRLGYGPIQGGRRAPTENSRRGLRGTRGAYLSRS